jgi:hypothetical protein
MIYCEHGPWCAVEVFGTTEGHFECAECLPNRSNFRCDTRREMLQHLEWHRRVCNDLVPEYAFERLRTGL